MKRLSLLTLTAIGVVILSGVSLPATIKPDDQPSLYYEVSEKIER